MLGRVVGAGRVWRRSSGRPRRAGPASSTSKPVDPAAQPDLLVRVVQAWRRTRARSRPAGAGCRPASRSSLSIIFSARSRSRPASQRADSSISSNRSATYDRTAAATVGVGARRRASRPRARGCRCPAWPRAGRCRRAAPAASAARTAAHSPLWTETPGPARRRRPGPRRRRGRAGPTTRPGRRPGTPASASRASWAAAAARSGVRAVRVGAAPYAARPRAPAG